MEAVTTFYDHVTELEIHDIKCECADAETVYQPGKEIAIKGTNYIIERVVRCINGSIQYKVYVKVK